MPVTKPAYPTSAPTQGLFANIVGAWLNNENTGTTAHDSSGNGNSGTLSGSPVPAWGVGNFGLSDLVFTAADSQYVTIGNKAALDLHASVMTILGWVYVNTLSGNQEIIANSSADTTFYSFGLRVNSTGHLVTFANGAGSAITSTSALTAAGWHQVALVRSGSAGAWTYTFYLDGVAVGATATGANPDANQITIYGAYVPSANFLDGAIDHLIIYNAALASGDISARFTNPFMDWPAAIGLSHPLANGDSGSPYSQTITATGGTGPYTFAKTAGTLPTGLTLSTAGVLSGTPTATGTFTFTITATDSLSATGSQAYTVTINTAVSIVTLQLPNAVQGQPYNQTIVASGGSGGYTFSKTAGSFPGGITLSTAGILSGTPGGSGGAVNFTVTVTDSVGGTAVRVYGITNFGPVSASSFCVGLGGGGVMPGYIF
jgi:hypothetical protein